MSELITPGISVLAFRTDAIIHPTASACAGVLEFFHPEHPRWSREDPPVEERSQSRDRQAAAVFRRDLAQKLHAQGRSLREIAAELGVSFMTIIREARHRKRYAARPPIAGQQRAAYRTYRQSHRSANTIYPDHAFGRHTVMRGDCRNRQ